VGEVWTGQDLFSVQVAARAPSDCLDEHVGQEGHILSACRANAEGFTTHARTMGEPPHLPVIHPCRVVRGCPLLPLTVRGCRGKPCRGDQRVILKIIGWARSG
jgi:hypothetical protein